MGVRYAQRGMQVHVLCSKGVAAQEAEMGGMDGHDVDPAWNRNPGGRAIGGARCRAELAWKAGAASTR